MRRTATWLVVGAVLVVGGVAVVEVFSRDRDKAPTEREPAETSPRDLPAQLEAAGARGLLYMTIEESAGCELRAVRLPTLDIESSFRIPDCRFAVAPNGLVATGHDCARPGSLVNLDGAVIDVFNGCAPAWKPSGELTFVHDGAVLEVPRDCASTVDDCAEVVLSKGQLRQGLRGPDKRATLREIAWLDSGRMAAVLRGRGDFVAVFEDGELIAPPSFGTDTLTGLTADRARRRFLAVGGETQGAFELDDRGQFEDTFSAPAVFVQSAAVGPDGTWAAAAGRATVVVFQTGDPPGRAFQLPFEAEALAWREP
jgi:hypothetical protein